MSYPASLLAALSPRELDFMAECELVQIEPLASLPRISLLQDEFGPFVPPRLAAVPLWLALILRERDLCIIKPPDWLRPDFLAEKVREEATDQDSFAELPFRFFETAALLLQGACPSSSTAASSASALAASSLGPGGGGGGGGGGAAAGPGAAGSTSGSMPDAGVLKSLLQDLREIRQAKARRGVEIIDDSHIRVDRMCMLELNEIRPSFGRAFQRLKALQLASLGLDGATQQNPDESLLVPSSIDNTYRQ